LSKLAKSYGLIPACYTRPTPTLSTTRRTLLERARDPGDQSAWRDLDATYRVLILRYARRLGLQAADAEDVRQVVMMSLARRLPGFVYRPEAGRFRDYLGSAVRNAVAKHFSRQIPDSLDLSLQEPTAPPGDDALWDEEWTLHHYRRAMNHIRTTFPSRSLVIFDALLAGEPVESLAQRFDTSAEAIYKIKQRLRDRLKERIALQVHAEEFSERPA